MSRDKGPFDALESVLTGSKEARTPLTDAIDDRPAQLAANVAANLASEVTAEPAVSRAVQRVPPKVGRWQMTFDLSPEGGMQAHVTTGDVTHDLPSELGAKSPSLSEESDSSKERAPGGPLRVLLLCNYDPYNAATVCDHINSIYKHSKNDIFVLSNIGHLPDEFTFDPFDVIIIHYSLFVAVDAYVPPAVRKMLAKFVGLKVVFIQDEYRFVNRTIEALNYCGIDIVFTCVPEGEIPKVYPPHLLPRTQFFNVLTGYVPESLKLFKVRPLGERPIEVGYRGRVYPAWHGEAGREKHEIGRRFLMDSKRHGVKCDIAWSEDSRLYGIHWVNFLRRCRATLAVESGASVFDFDGRVSAATETFTSVLGLSTRQSRNVRRLLKGHKPFDQDPEGRAVYEEIRELFFANKEGLIDLAQLSPRVFEAATLRTMLIMYEGSYSGAFQPWRHYVPLKKDHSNMSQVVEVLRDPVECAKIITNCYAEVCENEFYSASAFVNKMDKIIDASMTEVGRSKVEVYSKEEFYKQRMFYYIPYAYSLDPNVFKRLPRHPVKLVKALVKPGPNDLTLRDIFMRYIRRNV